jgi:hypothetical protein
VTGVTWGATSGASRPDPTRRFHDDLVGLDPDDPEARAFAEHLDRMERVRPMFTVEGELNGVRDFAESANRVGGLQRWAAWLLAVLVLLGAGYVIYGVLEFLVGTWLI